MQRDRFRVQDDRQNRTLSIFLFRRSRNYGKGTLRISECGFQARMLEDTVISETTNFSKTGGSQPSTQQFYQDRVHSFSGHHK
jgi:hypothetical protein